MGAMRVMVPWILIGTSLLAACLESPPPSASIPTCAADACAKPVSTQAPPPPSEFIQWPREAPFPPLPVNKTLRSIRNEGCWGIGSTLHIPESNIRKVVPPDFDTVGIDPVMGFVIFEALKCDRIVIGNQIVKDVYSFQVSPGVAPKNDSWGPDGRSFLEFERYFSSQEVASFYRGLGFPAEVATFEIGSLPLLSGGSATWTIKWGSAKFTFEYLISNEAGSNRSSTNHFWLGSNPYLRVDQETTYVYYKSVEEIQVGVLRVEGDSKTARLLGAPAAVWDGDALMAYDQLQVIQPNLFVGGNA